MRKIVLLDQPDLAFTTSMVEFTPSSDGFRFDPAFESIPVNIPELSPFALTEIVPDGAPTILSRADFVDERAEAAFLDMHAHLNPQIFADPEIEPIAIPAVLGPVCPSGPVGSEINVSTKLNLGPLSAAGCDGKGVRVAIVDTGVQNGYKGRITVSGGFSPFPGVVPGGGAVGHGTMCAWDVLIAAPNAIIEDYPLLQSRPGGGWIGFMSDAIRIYAQLLASRLTTPGPLVVNNSWAMFNRKTDAPVGSSQNYSANPKHPFNTIVQALVSTGADVIFAAGNCGLPCPDGRCGTFDKGPANSIMGANGHPDVITVSAVTVLDNRLGYSSQGPALLDPLKPDISGFSHFVGSGVFAADSGTSAACPVVAGVVAALRSKASAALLPPSQIKAALTSTARLAPVGGFDNDTGHGIVDAGAAFALV